MYTLIKGLYVKWNQKPTYSVLILGLERSGKTTFLERVKSIYNHVSALPPENIISTVGQNIGRITINNTKIQFWDLGGRSSLRSLWYPYFSECHSIILMIDSSEKERIQETKDVFEALIRHEHIKQVPILILVNKQDISESLKVEEIKTILDNVIEKLDPCKNHIMPTSAVDGRTGVQEAIEWLKNQMEQNAFLRKPIY
ncbi:hypothetical protein PORY_001989 [Pneumocystis oryctolagi]|uniref:Uncharacterized protein n=1 Tax=Pneumocystis oryctolagi TaxID=42067 RepID=A0ACB7CAH9_9ASCO|nr:hypothetical protein PORY_001989 [Pneumocystis oryctolagi]